VADVLECPRCGRNVYETGDAVFDSGYLDEPYVYECACGALVVADEGYNSTAWYVPMADAAAVLAEHWLARVECDPDTKTDRAHCSCSLVAFPVRPSVGDAVRDWAEHVAAVLAAQEETRR
jgi:hypothetical protein